ncbi:Glycosyl transferase, family 1 [Cynara cardunculus var. scolymus]|uniref:Glycosyl transferase, family 1 n=1 Tax=Cynara cardunculus var. scolymus TaxID=59895 RepID=A0A103XQ78_CYNCS|nr:Glycosyl transferase, family 1 [Cynara cardunculus var. scolymus]
MPTSLISLNPSISLPSSSASASSSSSSIVTSSRISCFYAFRQKPICFTPSKPRFFRYERRITTPIIVSSAKQVTIEELRKDDEEGPPSQVESEVTTKPRRIALFVEPSPFAYVSGYKNRFQNFIKYLREMGDEVMVITTHEGVPQEFHGAKLVGSRSPRIINEVKQFKPDIIHASSPGIMVFGALAIAKMLCVPIVMSYHTHVPVYIPRYTFSWLVKPMWLVLKFLHRAADLTLVPSAAIAKDLRQARVTAANKIRLWNKGVDSESFNPIFRSQEMRVRLTEDLEKLFVGMPAVFTGTLQGDELSQAYASGDVFVMPSESETLGLVVLEAMSSGLPVVAARAGGIPDIIPEEQEGKTGYLYTPGDLDDCLNKLVPLLHDAKLRENIGQAARVEMEKFDWRAATKMIRNQQYNAAIWFWRKKRAQLLKPVQWVSKIFFPIQRRQKLTAGEL